MSVYLNAGSVLLDSGKVATSSSCCCGGNTGACCDVDDVCTEGVTQSDCEGAGGTYLGDGSTCTDVDCTCCPVLAQYTTLTLSGTVTGCGSGSATLGSVTYNLQTAGPGCDLDMHKWSTEPDCGCAFQAQCCIPFTETGEIHSDNTNDDCEDPDYGGCSVTAIISCNGTVQFLAGTASGTVCCDVTDNLTSGFYAIPTSPGSISVSLAGGGGLVTFNITLTFA